MKRCEDLLVNLLNGIIIAGGRVFARKLSVAFKVREVEEAKHICVNEIFN